MVIKIDPDDIKNEKHLEVYVKLLELDLNEDMSKIASHSTNGRFSATDFIDYFDRRREFSEKQISYVSRVYNIAKRYKEASSNYKKNGYLDELIWLMEAVAKDIPTSNRSFAGHKGNLIQKMNELSKGKILYGNQFSSLRFCIGHLPPEKQEEKMGQFDDLCGKYWEIYRGLRDEERENERSS